MRRKLPQFLLSGLLFALPAGAAQENPPPVPPAPPAPKAQDKPQASQKDIAPEVPASAEEDMEVGTFYMHKGDIDAAIPRFEDAIRAKPGLAKPRILLAEAYEKKGDNATAVKYYKEYLRVFPSAPDARKIKSKIEKLTSQ